MSADPDNWLARAVAAAERGVLLAYPTETVWGLGADAAQPDALRRLRQFKGLRGDKPFSVLVDRYDALAPLGFETSVLAAELAERFWPGPLTLVLRCGAAWARDVGRADGAVGLRCSSHPSARRLAEAVAGAGLGPLTATSLNRSGAPPARTQSEAARLCAEASCHLAAPPGVDAGGGEESTIVDLTTPAPAVLRSGALPPEALAEWELRR